MQQRNEALEYAGLALTTPRQYFENTNDMNFRVRKLTNGYTVSGVGWEATYFPDIPSILRHIAYAIGGEDAVPLDPVSPAEAGLFDPNEPTFDLTPEDSIHRLIATYRLDRTGKDSPWNITGEIDAVFKAHGFTDYHGYCKRAVGSVDEDEVILGELIRRFTNVAYPQDISVNQGADIQNEEENLGAKGGNENV